MKIPHFLTDQGMENLQRMSHMIRYNNEIHFHDENVAEHSFYVGVYSILICDALRITGPVREKIVERAITHDVSETELSDIPHNVKMMVPGLSQYFEEHERGFNNDHFGKTYSQLWETDEILISAVVEIADILSVKQYSKQEVELGNKRKFEPILKSTNERLRKAFEKLRFVSGDKNVDELETALTESEV